MKKVIFFMLMSSMLMQSTWAQKAVCQQHGEALHCGAGELEYINHLGHLYLKSTHIRKTVNLTGDLNATDVEISKLKVLGRASLLQSRIIEALIVRGEIWASQIFINNDIDVIGNVHMSDSYIQSSFKMKGEFNSKNNLFQNTLIINGVLQSDNDDYQSEIRILSCEATLTNSITKNIIMDSPSKCSNSLKRLVLKGITQINGDIKFKGGNGKVLLGSKVILNGKVEGGKIEKI